VFDKLISSLGKRVFVLHNIHSKSPQLFQTRWTMNFLAGPLTRVQIPALNRLVNADASTLLSTGSALQPKPVTAPVSQPVSPLEETQPSFMAATRTTQPPITNYQSPSENRQSEVVNRKSSIVNGTASQTKPSLPPTIREYFLPQNYSLPEAFKAAGQSMPGEAMIQGIVYRPALVASAQVRILDRKLGVESDVTRAAVVNSLDKRGSVRWEDYLFGGDALANADTSPTPSSRFGAVDTPLNDAKSMTALQKDFADWVYRNSSVTARANQALKVFAGPDVSRADFMKACADAAAEARDAEIAKKTATLDRQIKTIEDKLAREERELQMDQTELEHRKWEERGNMAELGASLLGIGRKKSLTSQLSKNRLTEKAKAEVEESVDAIAQFKQQITDLEKQREAVISEINDRWGRVVSDTTEVTVTPKKTDIFVNLFGVGWMPYYVIQTGEETMELPAFGEE
jgi:hypothetical protein